MSGVKELKSIELSSYTIIVTGIAVLFSILSSIIVAIGMTIFIPTASNVVIYLIPTIIVGTLMFTIYNSFFEGFLYNTLAKKLNTIKLELKDEKEIVKISTTETAMMTAIIMTIQVILLYLVSVFILPLLINAFVQTLLFSGQNEIAFSLYQILLMISQPTTIAMVIFGTFIISFVFVLLGTYIYNFIANSGRGIIVNLTKENNMTILNSIDTLKLAIAFAIVVGVLNLILAIISIISGGDITSAVMNVIGGFVGSFIDGALIAIFYNFLAPKLGKLKIELID